MNVRLARSVLIAVAVAGSSACGAAASDESATPEDLFVSRDGCPVTVPAEGFQPSEPEAAVYTEHFPPPGSYPTEYPDDGHVWYGSGGLWTELPVDGLYDERKTVFWSTNFSGGTVEENPDLTVTWTRLDTEETVVFDNDGYATNGYTPEHGWFMITSPEERLEAGCWRVYASYKGATLTYVYQKH